MGLTLAIKQRMHAVLKTVIEVGIDVATAHRCDSITAGDYLLHLPARSFRAACLIRCVIIDNSVNFWPINDSTLRQFNIGFCRYALVAVEVQSEENRNRTI